MSDPNSFVPKVRADVLPGYTLAQPGWMAKFTLEDQIHVRFEARFVQVGVLADPTCYEAARAAASSVASKRPFAVDTDAYFDVIREDRLLTPYLLWGTLRKFHKDVTLAAAEDLLTDDNFWEVRGAVLELWGFVKKPAAGVAPPTTPAGSTGAESVPITLPAPSANAETAGTSSSS